MRYGRSCRRSKFLHRRSCNNSGGFTLAELVIALTVLSIVAFSLTGLFTSLANSAVIAKEKAVASALATNQMEYLKSLPYDSLAVAGGSIYTTNPLPASTSKTLNGITYTVKTNIGYIDDAMTAAVATLPKL